jgi:hypothetical protein
MGQLMFAESVKRGCRHPVAVEGYNIPEWGLSEPLTDAPSSDIRIGSYLTRSALCSAMIDAFKPTGGKGKHKKAKLPPNVNPTEQR